jgi:hypothetical protein
MMRTKGWRMPPKIGQVDRTTKRGNPFIVGREYPFVPGRLVQDRRHAWNLYLGLASQNEKLVAGACGTARQESGMLVSAARAVRG